MNKIKRFFWRLFSKEEGASALEYALMAAMVAVVVAAFVTPVGDGVKATLKSVCSAVGGTACPQ